MPGRRTITLEPYRGQWPPDDADAGFRQLVSEYSAIDPMPTLEELGRRKGIPVGALVAFVLARYCASGSEALLYAGPIVVRQMEEIVRTGGGRRHRRRQAGRLPRPQRDRVVAQGSAGGPELAPRRMRVTSEPRRPQSSSTRLRATGGETRIRATAPTAMESRYQDEAVRGLDLVDQLVQVSRWVGAETSLAVWGGGNTSVKLAEPDLLGRSVRVLRVKGSGSDLKSVTRRDFPGVRLPEVLALLERDDMGDQEMVDYLARCLQEPGSPRPSIETLLHGFLDAEAVIHTHADAIVGLTNTERGREVVEDLFGKETVWVPYRRPGFRLSREVWAAIRARPEARAIVLEKHGLSTWGATLKDAYLATIDLVTRAEERLRDAARARRPFGPPTVAAPDAETRRRVAREIAPVLRGMLGRDRRVVLRFDDGEDIRELAGAPEAARLTQIGPATPDHTIYSKRLACFVPLGEPASPAAVVDALRAAVPSFVQDYTAYFEAHRHGELMRPGGGGPAAPSGTPALTDPFPRVVLLPGLGHVHERQGRADGGDRRRHLPPHRVGHPGGVGARVRTRRSRRRTPSTSSSGRSSSTSSRWRRPRRSWRVGSRWSPGARAGSGGRYPGGSPARAPTSS